MRTLLIVSAAWGILTDKECDADAGTENALRSPADEVLAVATLTPDEYIGRNGVGKASAIDVAVDQEGYVKNLDDPTSVLSRMRVMNGDQITRVHISYSTAKGKAAKGKGKNVQSTKEKVDKGEPREKDTKFAQDDFLQDSIDRVISFFRYIALTATQEQIDNDNIKLVFVVERDGEHIQDVAVSVQQYKYGSMGVRLKAVAGGVRVEVLGDPPILQGLEIGDIIKKVEGAACLPDQPCTLSVMDPCTDHTDVANFLHTWKMAVTTKGYTSPLKIWYTREGVSHGIEQKEIAYTGDI